MRSFHFWLLGMFAAVLIGVASQVLQRDATGSEDPEGSSTPSSWLPAWSDAQDAEPPVIVLLLESRGQLERLRSALGDRELLEQSERAFVLDGLIATSDLEAVSAPLNALGWANRPLEIVSRDLRSPEPGSSDTKPHSPQHDAFAKLARKDKLTRNEALELLEHLDKPLPRGR